jgi:predicted PurR-regulated permease PerM
MSKNKTKTLRIEISLKSLLLIVGVVAGSAFVFSIRNVLFMFFWAFIFSSALIPAIAKIEKVKFISRGLAVAIVYIVLLVSLVGLFTLVSVPLARETIKFVEKLPEFYEQFINFINNIANRIGLESQIAQSEQTQSALDQLRENLIDNFSSILSAGASGISGVVKLLSSVFGGLFNLVSVLTMSVYISLDHDNFLKALPKAVRDKDLRKDIRGLIQDIENKLGNWISGKVILSLMVGVMSWVLLKILGVQYVWPLAIFVVLMDSIPTIGATLSAIPAVIVTLASGNIIQIIGVPVGYILIQQIENNYLAPEVMSTAIGLPPIIIILAVLVGAHMGGILGILVAIPLVGVAHLTIDFFINRSKD